MKKDRKQGDSTISVHGGEDRVKYHDSITVPILHSSTYIFRDEKDVADYTSGRKFRYEYLRYGNPTINAAEAKLASIEGAEHGILFASGMNAITSTLFCMLNQGNHIIITSDIYKKTFQFVKNELPRFGVTYSVTAPTADAIAAAIKPETTLIFSEAPTNPFLYVADIPKLTAVAKKAGIPVIIDSTFATPLNMRPLEMGADIVIHSATKYLGGHNDIMGGVVLGRKDLLLKVRNFLKTTGGNMDPHTAYLLIRGLKTLSLRVGWQNSSATKVSQWLEKKSCVKKVWYPGLKSHPDHNVAKKIMTGFGGCLSFEYDGTLKQTQKFLRNLKMIQMGPSLGGTESLISHPATINYYDITRPERLAIGITDQLVRLAVGVEDPQDIIHDLEQAMASV